MTLQEKLKSTLAKTGLPYKQINVYGRQIVITCWSRDAAEKWAHLVAKFAKFRGITQSVDDAKVNKNTVLLPSQVEVWRTFAEIKG